MAKKKAAKVKASVAAIDAKIEAAGPSTAAKRKFEHESGIRSQRGRLVAAETRVRSATEALALANDRVRAAKAELGFANDELKAIQSEIERSAVLDE